MYINQWSDFQGPFEAYKVNQGKMGKQKYAYFQRFGFLLNTPQKSYTVIYKDLKYDIYILFLFIWFSTFEEIMM